MLLLLHHMYNKAIEWGAPRNSANPAAGTRKFPEKIVVVLWADLYARRRQRTVCADFVQTLCKNALFHGFLQHKLAFSTTGVI